MSVRNVGPPRVRPHRLRSVRARRPPPAAVALASLPAAAVAVAAVVLYLLGDVGRVGVLIAVMVLLAAAAAALAAWSLRCAAGRALRPVVLLQREMEGLDESDPGRRVGVPVTGGDIARLAGGVNTLLERLEIAAVQRRSFISDASHELRTPITGLRTRIELALDAPDDGDVADTLRHSLADIERLHQIVEDLLVLARLDAGEVPVRERLDLGALVETEIGRRASVVPVTVKAEPGILVRASRPRLGRVLVNLLANADRHAVAMIEVQVRAEAGEAVVEVHDDGPGIPPADRDRVFERFARLDSARSRAEGGSGLGLAIARQIAIAHGGRLYVADGSYGARLVLRLPLADQA
ncbi:sensor histidine kinase [Spirillospora sp. CA-128828]|uniref:sensor histidine kinase n=1 Tax=Spirillospora sp. CA-128828 TaxID=3240033 RepID=UPI003D93EE91